MLRLLIALALLLPVAGGEAADTVARRKGPCRLCACAAFAGPGIVCKRAACKHTATAHRHR